jgi:hypothetical protein
MFESRFEVLVDEPIVPAMGAEFLTEDLKRELHEFDEYELLSNDVLFLLRAPV